MAEQLQEALGPAPATTCGFPRYLSWPPLDFPEAGTLLAPGKVGVQRGQKLTLLPQFYP